MKLKISKGNSKVGRIPSVSHTPIRGCAPGVPCTKDCYAMKSYRMYPNVRNAWDSNLSLWESDPSAYISDIRDWLTRNKPKMFRYFVAGDIPDSGYVGMMCETADMFPNIKFLAFTKRHDLFDTDTCEFIHEHLPNLSVVASMWPCWGNSDVNLPKAWMQDGSETRVPETAVECQGNCETCGMCWSLGKIGRDVVFRKH